MGFTYKVLEKQNPTRDEMARRLYYSLPPPQGVFGVNVRTPSNPVAADARLSDFVTSRVRSILW